MTTGAEKSGSHVQIERALGSKVLRVYGSIAVDSQPDEEEVAIHDPAEYAAMALKGMLEARGIVVTGKARAEHRISTDAEWVCRSRCASRSQSIGRSLRCVLWSVRLQCTCFSCRRRLLATHQSVRR